MLCVLGCVSVCSMMVQPAVQKVCMLLVQATLHAYVDEPCSEGKQNI